MANKRPMEQYDNIWRLDRRIKYDDPVSNPIYDIDSLIYSPQPHIPAPPLPLTVVAQKSGDNIDTSWIPSGFVEAYTELYRKCNELDCAICVEELDRERDEISMINICRHMFHTICLERWYKKNHTCPMCRSEDYSRFNIKMERSSCEMVKLTYGPGRGMMSVSVSNILCTTSTIDEIRMRMLMSSSSSNSSNKTTAAMEQIKKICFA